MCPKAKRILRGKLLAEHVTQPIAMRIRTFTTKLDHCTIVFVHAGYNLGDSMESCVKCHFYDRKNARAGDNRTTLWGQCRRHSPQLNPLNTKSYAIEGVWPIVRDDDWCGEWRTEVQRPAERVAELLNG